MSKKSPKSGPGISEYLMSKLFVKQLLLIIGLFLCVLLIVVLWLRFYTNHGQKLKTPDLVSLDVFKAKDLVNNESFELVVDDSIFIVGKPGGIITDQTPKPGALIKENRKIYVTITKYQIEKISVEDLPVLYGNAFEQKKTELKYRDIDCIIKDYVYDPGEANHIIEVWYKGELIISKDVKKSDVLIEKGDFLECVISKNEGGEVTIPDLLCLDLDEARFLLETSKLGLGSIFRNGIVYEDDILYIVSQSPPYDGITFLNMGEKVNVTVSKTKPTNCN